MADDQPFRFLTSDEFMTLPPKERTIYLVRASHEIEERQKVIRVQLEIVKRQEGTTSE